MQEEGISMEVWLTLLREMREEGLPFQSVWWAPIYPSGLRPCHLQRGGFPNRSYRQQDPLPSPFCLIPFFSRSLISSSCPTWHNFEALRCPTSSPSVGNSTQDTPFPLIRWSQTSSRVVWLAWSRVSHHISFSGSSMGSAWGFSGTHILRLTHAGPTGVWTAKSFVTRAPVKPHLP